MAGPVLDKPTDTYSPVFGYVYIFNLIIGVGALSLPKAFSQAGLILGTILLSILAFMSYMTATFMTEAMAIANALLRFRKRAGLTESSKLSSITRRSTDVHVQKVDESGTVSPSYGAMVSSPSHTPTQSDNEKSPLVPAATLDKEAIFTESDDMEPVGHVIPPDDFEITTKFEMGELANQFYHPVGVFLYYVVICLYLYGDLAIYAVAIPRSITKVVCPPQDLNKTNFTNMSNLELDWDLSNSVNSSTQYCFAQVTEQQAYYIFLSITLIILCPWTFFNLTKSKWLQLFTTIMRNVAFALMVGIAISYIAQGHRVTPTAASFAGFPLLFGVSIYAFMCQHSLPGMITPMRSKRGLFSFLAVDFAMILSFYLLLAYTGAFWLSETMLNDIYTLNFFIPFPLAETSARKLLSILGYYLALFPVFTLSTNFPIISITLRENLKALSRVLLKRWVDADKPYPWPIEHLLFPILALVIPIAIAFGTQNVELLVSITGSFPGVGVQYVIPVTLAFCGKYLISSSKRLNMKYENKYKSPFSYVFFLVFVLIWTAVSVVLIIVDDAIKISNGTFLDG